MKLRHVLAATIAVTLAVPALAADNTPDKGDKAPKEKKICRTEMITGSLVVKRRICKTQAEWDELAAATKKGVDDYTRRYAQGAPACISGVDITCDAGAGPR